MKDLMSLMQHDEPASNLKMCFIAPQQLTPHNQYWFFNPLMLMPTLAAVNKELFGRI